MREVLFVCAACVCTLLYAVPSVGHQIRIVKQFDGDLFDNPLGYEEECLAAGALCAGIDEPLRYCNETQSPASNCSACKCEVVTPHYNSTLSECQARNVAQCRTQTGFDFDIALTVSRDAYVVRQILLPDKKFVCKGKVSSWLLRLQNTRISSWLLFQVWRDNGSSSFSLIGSQRIDFNASSLPGYTDTYYRFPVDQHITCEPGDIIGIYTPFGVSNFPFENGYAPSGTQGSSRAYLYGLSDSTSPPRELTLPALAFYRVPSTAARFVAFTVDESYECANTNLTASTLTSLVLLTSSSAATENKPTPTIAVTPGGTQPSDVWSDDSADILTVAISALVPTIAGLLALIAVAALCICRQRRQSGIYTTGAYEQPMSLKGPSRVVGPMEYEVAVITPYATCTAAADPHHYDIVREPESGVYEKMQSYVPTTRVAEPRKENMQYENFNRAPADYLQFTPQKNDST